ncbi:MAG: hypothetical protein ACI9MR_005089, partial [Myxococcota bacterium]
MSTHFDATPLLAPANPTPATDDRDTAEKRGTDLVNMIPFLLVHVAAFAAIWTGVSGEALAVFA